MTLSRSGISAVLALAALLPSSLAAERFGVSAFPRTRTIKVVERAGVARKGYPVEVTIRYQAGTVKDPRSLGLYRLEQGKKQPAPFQVLSSHHPKTTSQYNREPQSFSRIMFLADAPANGSAEYVLEDNPPPASTPTPAFTVEGEGVGRRIDTGPALFELHPLSGQFLAFTPKFVGDLRLRFRQNGRDRAFHHNPDVFAPPATWGHASDWNVPVLHAPDAPLANPPPSAERRRYPFHYRQWQKPLLYRLSRWGRMPLVPQVDTSVTYSFFANAPFVLCSSTIDFREGIQVQAVRNCELVFSRQQYDHIVWIDKAGNLQTRPCNDPDEPDRILDIIATMPPDTPCLGFANEAKGFGIALVMRGAAAANPYTGNAANEQSQFYFLDYGQHGQGSPNNFTYVCRRLVFRKNHTPTFVPAGSRYAAEYAVVVFALGKTPATRYAELKHWRQSLANPLHVEAD